MIRAAVVAVLLTTVTTVLPQASPQGIPCWLLWPFPCSAQEAPARPAVPPLNMA
jgi:hypothetical protein